MGQPGQTVRAPEGAAGVSSLVFRAGSLLCALPLDEVVETMRPLSTHPLAGTPAFVLGVSIVRGVPTPVVDVARLLSGESAEPSRFVTVRTGSGPVAFATGPVLGIRSAVAEAGSQPTALLGSAADGLLAGVGRLDAEPLLLLRSMRAVPDNVWAATARQGPRGHEHDAWTTTAKQGPGGHEDDAWAASAERGPGGHEDDVWAASGEQGPGGHEDDVWAASGEQGPGGYTKDGAA